MNLRTGMDGNPHQDKRMREEGLRRFKTNFAQHGPPIQIPTKISQTTRTQLAMLTTGYRTAPRKIAEEAILRGSRSNTIGMNLKWPFARSGIVSQTMISMICTDAATRSLV